MLPLFFSRLWAGIIIIEFHATYCHYSFDGGDTEAQAKCCRYFMENGRPE